METNITSSRETPLNPDQQAVKVEHKNQSGDLTLFFIGLIGLGTVLVAQTYQPKSEPIKAIQLKPPELSPFLTLIRNLQTERNSLIRELDHFDLGENITTPSLQKLKSSNSPFLMETPKELVNRSTEMVSQLREIIKNTNRIEETDFLKSCSTEELEELLELFSTLVQDFKEDAITLKESFHRSISSKT